MRKWKKKRYWIRSKLQEPTRHLVQACDAIASEWDPGIMTHRRDGRRATGAITSRGSAAWFWICRGKMSSTTSTTYKLLSYYDIWLLPAAKNLWSNSKPVELAGCWELRLGPALSTDCVLQSARRCAAHPAFSKIHAHKVGMAYTEDK